MAEPRAQRRLAAILAVDIVGYSRAMEADEAGALAQLRAWREGVLEPRAAAHGGRIVKLMGDGALVEFGSAVEAVQAAVAMQADVAPADRAAAAPPRLRIGVNLGDVVVEGDDLFGDGVNVAARLEALARPGEVLVSGAVYGVVRTALALDFVDRGRQSLKNITEPVRVYALSPTGDAPEAPADAAAQPAKTSERPALAVLPFNNIGDDPEQEYFVDGLTEDIITALSHWRLIPVIARNSTFSYKGQAAPAQRVAEELGARYVVEGGVRRAGRRLRITAQLVDAESGHHVWADKFDRQIEDIFDVQDEIAHRIAATIIPEMESFEPKSATRKRTEDLNAWDFYVRGLSHFYEETCEANEKARELFEKAVAMDPGYCEAWARLGWVHARDVQHQCTDNPQESLRRGFDTARQAVALDPDSALAHLSLGTVHVWAGEMETALDAAQTALRLNPNYAHAALAVGNRLDLLGATEEGVAQMRKALQLNPRDPTRWLYLGYLSRALVILGDYEGAAECSRHALSLRPNDPHILFRHAICLAHLDRRAEAATLLDRCEQLKPGFVAERAAWRAYPDAERSARLLAGLRRHDLLPPSP